MLEILQLLTFSFLCVTTTNFNFEQISNTHNKNEREKGTFPLAWRR